MNYPAFEILDHPADIGFRAYGRTLAKLFENAALALISIGNDLADVAQRNEYSLDAAAFDYESLLVAWLSEVLYWFDGKRIIFSHFQVTAIEPGQLKARAWGEPRNGTRHSAKLTVKAVTWHQLKIRQTGDHWMAEVYLDI